MAKEVNNKIYNLCKEMDVTRNIRLKKLQWVGHVLRMKEESLPKKALKGYIERGRLVGRHRGKWIDAVGKLKCKNWRRSAEDRDV